VDTLKTLSFVIFLLFSSITVVCAQKYQINPGPDLWFNTVDGVRFGVKVRGQMAGSFGEGPHRLNVGLWAGSKWPSQPISYYASFTELVPAWSSFGSEATLEAFSSVREGFYRHGLSFKKRWQNGFNENEFIQFNLNTDISRRYDLEYAAIPTLWETNSLYMIEPLLEVTRNHNVLGRLSHHLTARVAGQEVLNDDIFAQFEVEQQGLVHLSYAFKLRHRIFFATSSSKVPVQYQYRLSMGKAIDVLNNGFSRSKGTLPIAGFDRGWLHVSDGPNLRGYGLSEMKLSIINPISTFKHTAAVNLELDVPNPISWVIEQTPILGGILNNRMYIFNDLGQGWNPRKSPIQSNLGLGVSLGLNLPEKLGNNKVLTLRYDVPFWLSHPLENESNVAFRSIFGLSNIIRW
jgi:hypothetical protein